MLMHRRCLLLFVVDVVVSLTSPAPPLAFDDREFCVAARLFALAASTDIGLWIDRTTRNAGMVVCCDTSKLSPNSSRMLHHFR